MTNDPSRSSTHALPPLPLILLFAAVLLAGAALLFTRERRAEQADYEALQKCDARTLRLRRNDETEMEITDGLADNYGLVQFRAERGAISQYLSDCETKPEMARRVFRQALSGGNKSARMVAIYSAFFLGEAPNQEAKGWLEPRDFDALAARLDPDKEPEVDVRRAAQREVADLTVLSDAAAASQYTLLPAGLPPAPGEPYKIETHETQFNGKPALKIRWSGPDVAQAWWKEHAAKGQWDAAAQRFVIP